MIARFNTHSRIRSIRFKDIWAIAAIGVAFGLAWPWRGTDGGKVIFVSPAGSDWNSGESPHVAL